MLYDLSKLRRIAFCDPAGSKTGREKLKRTSARSAIVVIGVDDLIRIFVLHAWADRCSTDILMNKIQSLNELFQPKIFGMEANAMQSLFADAVAREAKRLQKRLPLVPVTQPTKIEKNWRIRTNLQSVVADGRLFVQENQLELQAELSAFPMSPTVDIIDALSSAVALAPRRAVQQARQSEFDALADYLRRSGATPFQIQKRIAELREGVAA